MGLLVGNIEVPVDVQDFITPDMEEVLEFYPEWRRQGGHWSVQSYFMEFCKLLERYEKSQGLPYKDRGKRVIEHFGYSWLVAAIKRYGEAGEYANL